MDFETFKEELREDMEKALYEDKYFKGGIMLRLDDMKEFTITFNELE